MLYNAKPFFPLSVLLVGLLVPQASCGLSDDSKNLCNQPADCLDGFRCNMESHRCEANSKPDATLESPDIRGVANVWNLSEGGALEQNVDLSDQTIAAHIPLENGHFDTFPGTGNKDGTFEIPEVPTKTAYVQLGQTYVVTDERLVDFSKRQLGRSDAAVPTVPTKVDLKLDGAIPREDGWVTVIAPNVGSEYGVRVAGANGTVTGQVEADKLLDSDRGDRLFALQSELQEGDETNNEQRVSAATKYFATDPITFVDGDIVEVTGSFQNIALTNQADIQIDDNALTELAGGMIPSSGAQSSRVLSVNVAAALSGVPVAFLGEVESWNGAPIQTRLSFGNPFPVAYTLWAEVELMIFADLVFPNGAKVFSFAFYRERGDIGEIASPVSPKLLPPRDILIDSLSASLPQVLRTQTPEIRWSAPSGTAPQAYRVIIDRVGTDGKPMKPSKRVGRIFTHHADLRVPPGLLEVGGDYALLVTSLHTSLEHDFLDAVFRFPNTWVSADARTGVISVR